MSEIDLVGSLRVTEQGKAELWDGDKWVPYKYQPRCRSCEKLKRQVAILRNGLMWCDTFTRSHGLGTIVIKDTIKAADEVE